MATGSKREINPKRLARVYEAAKGLCEEYDWNGGRRARRYRHRLVAAVNAVAAVANFEAKMQPESWGPPSKDFDPADVGDPMQLSPQ
jgi:hypothetical protein